MTFLYLFILYIIQILTIAIFVRVILSWFAISPYNPFAAIIYQITEPILGPLRRLIPQIGMFDFSPFVAIILLQVIASLVSYLP